MDILVAIDFSTATNKLLSEVILLPPFFDAKVWLIHAVEPEEPADDYFKVFSTTMRNAIAEHYHEEHKILQHHAQVLRDKGIDAASLLVQGAPVKMILQEAKNLDVSVIIIGSHGHGSLFNLLLGSISEGVLQKSVCPVLVVPIRES